MAMASEANAVEQQVDYNYKDEENRAMESLKILYMKTVHLDLQVMRRNFNIDKMFEPNYNAIYDNRRKIIEGFKKNNCDDDNTNESNIIKFWLIVLKASFKNLITKNDEKILAHLIDIRSELCNDLDVNITIKFHFEPNEYFSDSVLTKTYYVDLVPDTENLLISDGAEINKCKGCHINWKDQSERDYIMGEDQTSFFDFFSPPELPEDPEDDSYEAIKNKLHIDHKMGIILTERVIPKAIYIFTGEESSDK